MFTYQVPDPYQTFSLQILEFSRGNRIAPTIERNIPFPSHVGLPEIEPDPRHPGCISCIKLHQSHSSFVSSSIQSKENTIKYHCLSVQSPRFFHPRPPGNSSKMSRGSSEPAQSSAGTTLAKQNNSLTSLTSEN